MNWAYLVFLFPLLFGWVLMRRMELAKQKKHVPGEALMLFLPVIAVAVVTPAVWFYFDPPEPDELAPLTILAAETALICMFVGVCARWIVSTLAKKFAQRAL